MSFKQIMRTDQSSVEFRASGENVLLLTNHAGGTWDLEIGAPNTPQTFIATGETFNADGQVRFAVPSNTTMRLSGGSVGARAYVGEVMRRYNERM